MDFLPDGIAKYVESHTAEGGALLDELYRETWQKVLHPRMLSGHLQGRVLSLLSQMIAPNYILEIGTYTGYSTICLAEGLAPNGEIHTVDFNEEHVSMQQNYFKKAGIENKVVCHLGQALEIIPMLKHAWDLVFIDADKSNYINYFNLVMPKLKLGGLMVFDNVLWSGKVIQPVSQKDEDTKTLIALNEMIQFDKRLFNVLLPIRDGLMIARKISD